MTSEGTDGSTFREGHYPGDTAASAISHSSQHRSHSPPSRAQPPPPRGSGRAESERIRPSHGVLDRPTNPPAEGLKALSPRPLQHQRPSLEGRRWVEQSASPPRPSVTTGTTYTDHVSTGTNNEGLANGGKSGDKGAASTAVASSETNISVSLQGRGEFERDRENKVRQGSPVPLPKGMTGELMRQVAALDVTRMSCDQITKWFASEDTTGKRMQHQVTGVTGKDLLRALHEAPTDMAAWLDPACGEGRLQDAMKDERFKSLREGLVRTLAERSGKLAEIEALKLARKINHHKQVWSSTWKLVARGCCQSVLELRCLVRTLLYRLRVNGPRVSLDDQSVFADYVRFLLVPSQVYEVIGTAVAKALSGSLELILKNKTKRVSSVPRDESIERCLQSFVGVLCALCPCPAGDSRDTSSTSKAGKRLGDVCIVALPVVCPVLGKFRQMHTRCMMASFLSLLSWHDDNKIQMYQAAEETIPRVLLIWLCDDEMRISAKGDKYVASSRLDMATVIWNLSKRADNAAGLVQPETFDMLLDLLCRDEEEGDVLRRIVSCIQNLASMRRCASDLTDYIAKDPSLSNFLGTLFGLLARGGAKNMHQRVIGTFANLAYLCVAGGASTEWAGHLRESLKRFLLHFTETTDVLGNFNLDTLEARDRQFKFQGVRFEIARFLWCMIRLDLCHGASVDRLAAYISELDVLGASAGVFYENVPRTGLKHHEVVDLLQCIEMPCGRFDSAAYGEGGVSLKSAAHKGGFTEEVSSKRSDAKARTTSGREGTRDETVRTFALWILAHYTGRPDDRVNVASHGGLKVLTSVMMGPAGLVESVKAYGDRETLASKQKFISLKLAIKALANLCQAPQNAELVEPAGALAAVEALYSFATNGNDGVSSRNSAFSRAQRSCVPARYMIDPDFRKTYLVIQENLWRPIVKTPVPHEDGTMTIHYEVPAGNNECLELFKRVTPMDIERREFQVCRGEVPHQISVLAEVAACLSALAMHSSVLKLFAPSGVLGPFLQLSLEQLIPRETCLTALLNTPVKAYSQRSQVMRHVWSLITSTVLESEQGLPTDPEDSDGSGDGCGGAKEVENNMTLAGHDSARGSSRLTKGREGMDEVEDAVAEGSERKRLQKRDAERTAWSSRVLQQKLEQALAVRVLDRLVAGADEDAFESTKTGITGDNGDGGTSNEQMGNQAGPNRSVGGSTKMKRRRSSASAPVSIFDTGRRTSDEFRRQSVLMTSGMAYTISGILRHQVLLSGVIMLASPPTGSAARWKTCLPRALTIPIESAQRRLEYFCIGLAGSVSDAVRRNWLALDGERTNARNAMKALYELCTKHLAVLVDKAEVASSQAFSDAHVVLAAQVEDPSSPTGSQGQSRPREVSSPTASQNESRDELRSKACNQKDEQRSPSRKGRPSFSGDAHRKTQERGSDDTGVRGGRTRHDRRDRPAFRRQFSSFDSNTAPSVISAISSRSVQEADGSRAWIGAFLLPEEEQVVQMLFRAILSLLSIPEGFGFGEDLQPSSPAEGASASNLRQEKEDSNGKNRWGSFRGRRLQVPLRPAEGEAGNSTGGARSFGNKDKNEKNRQPRGLDDILWLCCRLLLCSPGDGVLHVSLLVVDKILSLPSRRRIHPRALDGVVPAVASFVGRPNAWVKHACLTLLHRMASGNELGGVLGLARGSKSRQMIACLWSVDSSIRLAAAKLVGILAKDAFCSKSIVFPEVANPDPAAPLDTGGGGVGVGGDGAASAHSPVAGASRRSTYLQSSPDWDTETSSDMDGDFDIRQRSSYGCIPPLLAMARLGGCNAERESALVEQEEVLCVLEDLASANNLCREAIVAHGGVPVLLQAAEACSSRARRAVAGLLAELSISPGQRDALKQAGGLLLLLQFQRSKDPDERIQANLALKNFGSDALSIHLAIARVSMEVLQKVFLRQGESKTVGRGLLRPIHDRQLREAAEGLAVCAMHKTSAANILSEKGLPMILDMLRVRDFDVQYSCIRALLHLIRHSGEHFSQAMNEDDRREAILQLTCLVRPVRERAARVLQKRLKEVIAKPVRKPPPIDHGGIGHTTPAASGGPEARSMPRGDGADQMPLKEKKRQESEGGGAYGGDGKEADVMRPTSRAVYMRKQGCVALALRGDMAELTRLASQCLELLASQSVTAVDIILSCDVVESLTAQLHTYDMGNVRLDQGHTQERRGRICEDAAEGRAANDSDGHLSSAATSKEKIAATRLQRQCIAALSSLALNSTGPMVRPASREAVERGLLFLAAFHWSNSVRSEANLALRRLQSNPSLPHPASWSVEDCLKWLSCVDLDAMCTAATAFLSDGISDDPFRKPGFRSPWIGGRVVGGSKQFNIPLGRQISGVSSATQISTADRSAGISTTGNGQGTPELLEGQQQQQQQSATAAPLPAIPNQGEKPWSDTADSGSSRGTRSTRGHKRGSLVGGAGLKDSLEGKARTAGTRLLQITRSDVSRSPFAASPEVSRKFLRSLRALRLHAFAASAMKQSGAKSQRQCSNVYSENSNRDNTRDLVSEGGPSHGCAGRGTDTGVLQWQERRLTRKRIVEILKKSEQNTEGIVVADATQSIGTGILMDTDTVEATDRFGSVLTLRLVRPSAKNQHSHRATTSAPTEVACSLAASNVAVPPDRRAPPSSNTGRAGCETESSQTYSSSFRAIQASPGVRSTAGKPLASGGGAERRLISNANSGDPGLKYLGRLTDRLGEETVEIYLGSFRQQALVSEAKRVLLQPRNRGLGVELVSGVVAVGVGRNSIGAIVTTSRPYKKFFATALADTRPTRGEATEADTGVTLEMSASLTERECPDPNGYISTTLAVIEDFTGVSNLFVLDLCDTANTQDPRDGRTSLMTAVLDNDESLVDRLLGEGVDIAVTDGQNRTALLHSVISKHDSITHILLAHHSELVRSRLNSARKVRSGGGGSRRQNKSGRTSAYKRGDSGGGGGSADVVSDLQAMLDQRDFTGKAALHHAVADMEERHKVVQALLAAKAQVNIRDAGGSSPLHIACQHGHVHIVKTLIVYNANPGSTNNKLMTPLHIASLNLRMKIVSVLLKEKQGGMVTAEDDRGWTALHYACRTLANAERSPSKTTAEDLNLIREGAEEVIQQLLRHGADLHSLDKSASKPLDFRMYFGERRDDIMQAVQDTLQYKVLAVRQMRSYVLSLPERLVWRIAGATDAWIGRRPAQARQRLLFQQSKQRYHAGRGIFSSARVQEAVREEWIQGSHRTRAVRMLLMYLVYLAVFTLSSVLNSGRDMPHGYHLTMSVRSAIESDSSLWDDEEIPYGTVDSVEQIWEWLQGPVLDLVYSDAGNSWYDGETLIDAQGWHSLPMLGHPRISQWRTAANSCEAWPNIVHEEELNSNDTSFCFKDYCGEDPGGSALCYGASMDSRSFGPDFKYEYVPDVHSDNIQGSFGVYGPGAFVHYITTHNIAEAATDMGELEADGWIDESTRAVALELAIHSFSSRKLMYVQILVELPAGGGVPLGRPSYNTFNTFSSFHTLRNIIVGPRGSWYYWSQLGNDGGGLLGDRSTFLTDMALLLIVLLNIMKENMEFRRQWPYYFLTASNLLDIILIMGHGMIFHLKVAKSNFFADMEVSTEQHYTNIRALADLVVTERQWVATLVILVWVKLMDPLQAVFQDFFLLVKMIALMIGKLVNSFLPLVSIIYVAWAFARYTLLGQLEFLMKSVSSTMATQYPETLGEFTFEEIRAESLYRTWRHSFTALFTMLVVVIMLNLLVSLLNDLYEELKSLAKADWCRAQATTIYMNARWHKQLQRRKSTQEGNMKNKHKQSTHQRGLCWCFRFPSVRRWLVRGEMGAIDSMKQSNATDSDLFSNIIGRSHRTTRSLQHLKEKAAALGRDHLDLAPRAKEDEAAALLASIIDRLDQWDEESLDATRRGEQSPLPPTETLRELFGLLTDNEDMVAKGTNNHSAATCWTLLRQNILVYLAGIIGADGKAGYAGKARPCRIPRKQSSIQVTSHGTLASFGSLISQMCHRASDLTESLTSLGRERRKRWNEARNLSIKIAQRIVEFLLSSAAADAGGSTLPQQQEVARAELGAPNRVGERAARHREYPQAGAAGTTRVPAPAPIRNKLLETYQSSQAVHKMDGDGSGRRRRSPLEDGGCCRSPGGERENDQVLRTMGGGYLLVTVLCTLSRALPAPGRKGVSDTSSASEAPSAAVVDDHRNPSRVSKHFGVAEEVAGLWLLLASLISMGSPSSKSTATEGEAASTYSKSGVLPGAENAKGRSRAAPALQSLSATATGGLSAPPISEVEAALAAGAPTAQRRRRSSGVFSVLPLSQHRSRPPSISDGRRPVGWGTASKKGRESVGRQGTNVEAAADKRPVGAKQHPASASFQGRGDDGRGEESASPLHDPTPHAQRSDARATTNPSEIAPSLSRGRRSGTVPKSSATPLLRSRLRSAHSERMLSSPPQGPALAGDRGGSGSRFAMGTSTTSQPTPAVEPRIPVEAFEMCGDGNFAVFLMVRWDSSNGGNGCGESGFEMLARLVLENAECALLSQSSRRPMARDGMVRKGGGGNGQGWKDPMERRTVGPRGLSSLLVGGPGLPSSGWRGKGIHRNSNHTRKWWASGEDVIRRRKSNGRFWDTPPATRSNSSFDSTSYGDGGGRGGSVFSTVEAAENGRQLSVLLTGLVRDYFLPQVKALLEGHRSELHTGVHSAACSNSNRSSTGGPGHLATRMERLSDAASSLARRTSKSIVNAIPSNELDQLSPRSSSIREGAALAYQVAVGDVGILGVPPKQRGSQALVEAGMVATLMIISRSTTPRSSSASVSAEQESEPSSRLLALACLGVIVAECSIEYDAAASPVRGLDNEVEGSTSHNYDAEGWGWDGAHISDGPVVFLSQSHLRGGSATKSDDKKGNALRGSGGSACSTKDSPSTGDTTHAKEGTLHVCLKSVAARFERCTLPQSSIFPHFAMAVELAHLFMDVMAEGMKSCGAAEAVAEEDEGEELADRSITALDLLLRACESHDWELKMAGMGLPRATDGAHGVVVDAIRSHSGYPSLELMTEATAAASDDERAWGQRGDAADTKQPPPQQQPGRRNRTSWWSHHFGGRETDKRASQSSGGLDERASCQEQGQTRVADVENLVDQDQTSTERQPLADAGVGAGATGLSSRNGSSKWQARIFPRG